MKLLTFIIPIFNKIIKIKNLNEFQKISKQIRVIIIEDGSNFFYKKKNKEIVSKFRDIEFFSLKNNRGQSFACNYGLKKTSSDYVWFFDSDDYIKIKTIKKVISTITKLKGDGYLLPLSQIYNGKIVKTVWPSKRPHDFNDLRNNGQMVNTSCAIFKTDKIRKIGGWDNYLFGGTDTDLFLRFSKIGVFSFIKTLPVKVDVSDNNRVSNILLRQLKAKAYFLNKHWNILTLKRKLYYIYSAMFLFPMFYKIKNYYHYKKSDV